MIFEILKLLHKGADSRRIASDVRYGMCMPKKCGQWAPWKIIFFVLTALALATGFVLLNNRGEDSTNDISSERCRQKSASYRNPGLPIEERVADLMSRMNDSEKIGQMVLVEKNSIHNISDITQYNLGALLSGGGAGIGKDSPPEWLQMINNFQSAAQRTCLQIPILYGVDAVHGNGNVFGSTIFPHSIGLGATRDSNLVEKVAAATAEEMAASGIYWSFSPNLDVVQD